MVLLHPPSHTGQPLSCPRRCLSHPQVPHASLTSPAPPSAHSAFPRPLHSPPAFHPCNCGHPSLCVTGELPSVFHLPLSHLSHCLPADPPTQRVLSGMRAARAVPRWASRGGRQALLLEGNSHSDEKRNSAMTDQHKCLGDQLALTFVLDE